MADRGGWAFARREWLLRLPARAPSGFVLAGRPARLRRAPTDIRDRALLTVLYRAGLRIEEALDLKPGDVDADRGTIRVLHGKGDHNRTAAIDDGAIAVVQLWLAELAKLGVNGRQRLFCTLQERAVSVLLEIGVDLPRLSTMRYETGRLRNVAPGRELARHSALAGPAGKDAAVIGLKRTGAL